MLIDRDFFRDLRAELDPVLAQMGKKLGVTFSQGHGSFERDGSAGSMKLVFTAITADGKAVNKEELDFTKLAVLYGLEPADLGKTFQDGNSTFKIVGLRRKATVNKIITVNQNGNRNVWPVYRVLLALGRKPKEPLFGSVHRRAPMSQEELEARDEGRAEARGS